MKNRTMMTLVSMTFILPALGFANYLELAKNGKGCIKASSDYTAEATIKTVPKEGQAYRLSYINMSTAETRTLSYKPNDAIILPLTLDSKKGTQITNIGESTIRIYPISHQGAKPTITQGPCPTTDQ